MTHIPYLTYSTLLFIIISLQNKTFGKTCGIPLGSQASSRIVGGYDVGYYKYSWFAIFYRITSVYCGGSLIAPRTILTAAHCFKPWFHDVLSGKIRLENIYKVKLGVYNRCVKESSQKKFEILQVLIHDEYMEDLTYFDIALVFLDKSTDGYAPICLPSPDFFEIIAKAREGTVQGMGRLTYDNTKLPCTLREARLLVQTNRECRRMMKRAGHDVEKMRNVFCAGYLEGGIDTCLGDSGGPFAVTGLNGHYFLKGITSFGFGCAAKRFLGIYTDVSDYLGWIKNKTNNAVASPILNRTTPTPDIANYTGRNKKSIFIAPKRLFHPTPVKQITHILDEIWP